MMLYNSIEELPDSVRSALPVKGQEIFLVAYNNAWQDYNIPVRRNGHGTREEVVFMIAWSMVINHKYEN